MSEWQPIETSPKDGTIILLYGGKPDHNADDLDEHENWAMPRPVSAWWNGRYKAWYYCSYDSGFYGEYESPTHWMPLPAPPQQVVDKR